MIRGCLPLVGIAACLAGCGGSAGEHPSTPAATLETYLSALASSDGKTACGVLTLYARARASEDSRAGCRGLVQELHATLGTDLNRLHEARLRISSKSDTSAEGTVTLGTRTAFAVFAEAGGEWRLDSPNVARLLLGFGGPAHL